MTYETTITRERFVNGMDAEFEIPITVEFTYYKARRGACDCYGAPMEPDEDESIEITSVFDTDSGAEIELTKAEQDRIEEQCIEHAEDKW